MEAVLIAAISSIPASIAGLAAWRAASKTRSVVSGNGNGNVSEVSDKTLAEVQQVRWSVKGLEAWASLHERRHREHEHQHHNDS